MSKHQTRSQRRLSRNLHNAAIAARGADRLAEAADLEYLRLLRNMDESRSDRRSFGWPPPPKEQEEEVVQARIAWRRADRVAEDAFAHYRALRDAR